MRVTYVPVLATLRDLYLQPRSMQRFRQYIATMTGGTDDIVLPIGVANPMAKEQAVSKIDNLLGLGAEEIAAESASNAAELLEGIDVESEIKASLVLVDDVGGGWTNRFTTEAMVRFPRRGALKRPFATGLVWTSESPTPDHIREEMRAAIYRVAHQQRHGLPATLRDMLDQEGRAGVFAGVRPGLRQAPLAEARAIVATLGDSAPYPQIFASMYGDAAAEQLGYQPLGLPARAGFEVALADALEAGLDPVALLAGGSRGAEEETKRDGHRT